MRAISTKVMSVVFLLGGGCIGLGNPQSAMADGGCSLATLRGVYLYTQSGIQIEKGDKQTPTALAGSDHFKGDGKVSGIWTSVTGSIVQRNVPYAGSYTVNSNCTGTYTVTATNGTNVTVNLDLFIAPSGNEFTYIATDRESVSTGLESRVATDVNP